MMAILVAAGLLAQEGRIETKPIEYRDGETVLEGFLAWDASVQGRRPGVLIVHEWKGHGDYVRMRAKELARLGYAAFALDMYGKGVFAKTHEEAGRLAGAFFGDRDKMRRRAEAGLKVLQEQEVCDKARIAAMGYCFGGATVLEMARAGQDVRGVASFHGSLETSRKAESVKAKVIVFHGADDSFIPPDHVQAFQEEMRKAKADWQLVVFGGAVHSFTVKEAGDDPAKGMAYNESADRRSWGMLKDFLAEVLR